MGHSWEIKAKEEWECKKKKTKAMRRGRLGGAREIDLKRWGEERRWRKGRKKQREEVKK